MLAHYFKLKNKTPHKLHSMILTEAIRLYKDAKLSTFHKSQSHKVAFSIVKFSNIWNLDNLREGDWNRKQLDGKRLNSTVEKLITAYTDEVEETHVTPDEKFITVIDRAMSKYKDSYNLMSQRASIHISSHETEKARILLRGALLLAQGKFHLWNKLAATVSPTNEPRLHIALLYKALRSPGQDSYKGKIRLSIAAVLAEKGVFAQALWELQQVKALYEQQGWHLPPSFNNIMRKIPSETTPDNPERLYKKVEHLADEEIFNSLPQIPTTKTYHKIMQPQNGHNPGDTAWRVTDNHGNNFWLHPLKFNIRPDLPNGTKVLIRVFNGKPVSANLSPE